MPRRTPDSRMPIVSGAPTCGDISSEKSLSDAREAAHGVKLDPSLPEGHFSLAQDLRYESNWLEAEEEYSVALNLDPDTWTLIWSTGESFRLQTETMRR